MAGRRSGAPGSTPPPWRERLPDGPDGGGVGDPRRGESAAGLEGLHRLCRPQAVAAGDAGAEEAEPTEQPLQLADIRAGGMAEEDTVAESAPRGIGGTPGGVCAAAVRFGRPAVSLPPLASATAADRRDCEGRCQRRDHTDQRAGHPALAGGPGAGGGLRRRLPAVGSGRWRGCGNRRVPLGDPWSRNDPAGRAPPGWPGDPRRFPSASPTGAPGCSVPAATTPTDHRADSSVRPSSRRSRSVSRRTSASGGRLLCHWRASGTSCARRALTRTMISWVSPGATSRSMASTRRGSSARPVPYLCDQLLQPGAYLVVHVAQLCPAQMGRRNGCSHSPDLAVSPPEMDLRSERQRAPSGQAEHLCTFPSLRVADQFPSDMFFSPQTFGLDGWRMTSATGTEKSISVIGIQVVRIELAIVIEHDDIPADPQPRRQDRAPDRSSSRFQDPARYPYDESRRSSPPRTLRNTAPSRAGGPWLSRHSVSLTLFGVSRMPSVNARVKRSCMNSG